MMNTWQPGAVTAGKEESWGGLSSLMPDGRTAAAAPGDREQGGSRPRLRIPWNCSRPYGFCQEIGQSRLDRAWTRTPRRPSGQDVIVLAILLTPRQAHCTYATFTGHGSVHLPVQLTLLLAGSASGDPKES